jgi:ABC-type transporter Mla maintaining outer membrane lipid asymmetry permease subunit MlaE
MGKSLTEIRSLARSHTRTALNVLVRIMRSKDATPAARVSAANAILDRGWGKAPQAIQNGDGALELIHRIELRADFQHLRRWRKSVEQAQSYTFKAVITVIVTGLVGAVWLGLKVMLGK